MSVEGGSPPDRTTVTPGALRGGGGEGAERGRNTDRLETVMPEFPGGAQEPSVFPEGCSRLLMHTQ